MTKFLKYSLFALALSLGTSTLAHAHGDHHDPHQPGNNNGCDNTAPEVDPSLAIGGFTLLGGTIAVAAPVAAAKPLQIQTPASVQGQSQPKRAHTSRRDEVTNDYLRQDPAVPKAPVSALPVSSSRPQKAEFVPLPRNVMVASPQAQFV